MPCHHPPSSLTNRGWRKELKKERIFRGDKVGDEEQNSKENPCTSCCTRALKSKVVPDTDEVPALSKAQPGQHLTPYQRRVNAGTAQESSPGFKQAAAQPCPESEASRYNREFLLSDPTQTYSFPCIFQRDSQLH